VNVLIMIVLVYNGALVGRWRAWLRVFIRGFALEVADVTVLRGAQWSRKTFP
jgi:hypothetical protein